MTYIYNSVTTVNNFPTTQNVVITGTLAGGANVVVTNFPAAQNVTILGNANATVTNWPATQNVYVINNPATENVYIVNTPFVNQAGTWWVNVNAFPATQNVYVLNDYSVNNVNIVNTPFVSQAGTWWVNVNAFPATQNVFVTNTPSDQNVTVIGTANVSVTNLPATQNVYVINEPSSLTLLGTANVLVTNTPANQNVTVTGTANVLVTNLPATQNVLVTNTPSIQNVFVTGTANVLVTNLTANQNVTVTGIANVLITNLPANQNVTVTGTANVLITNLPANQNVTVTGTANVLITNLPSVQNVQVVANNSLAPIYVQYASSVQQDALGRLKVSMVQDQTWYAPTVDKDGDLRWTELFTSNVVTTTASSTRTSNILTLASSTGIYAGAVVTDGSGVLYSPPTYVVSVIGSNVLLNQNATVTSGAVLTFNNNTRLATAAGDQNLTSNLVVSSTTGISPWDQVLNITPGTANVFPFNTFVVSVANATVLTLNQNVSVSNADTISFSTASSYFNENTSDISMTPGNTADGSAIRQTRITQRIIPGVSHTVYQSVNFNGNDSNTVKKFGLYNDHGGMYWQINGTTDSLAAVVRRTQPDGTIYEDVVYRPNFNIDPLDGTGASKFNITTTQNVAITSWASTVVNPNFVGGHLVTYNVTANQGNTFALGSSVTVSGVTPATFNGTFSVSSYGTSNVTVAYPTNPGVFGSLSNGNLYQSQYHKYFTWWIEFIGGRTGRIRFGLGTTAGPTIAHTFNYSGVLSSTFVSTASLPVRYEINNVATVPYHPTMLIAGSTFNLEAGQSVNPGFGVSTFTTGWLADATLSPIIGIGLRAQAPFNSADMQLKSFTMLDTANRVVGGGGAGTLYGAYYWQLILNPLISGPIPVPVNSGKASRYWKYQPGANIVPNTGVLVDSGFFTSQITQSNETITNFLNMGKDVQGYNPDQLVLCVQQLAAGANGGNIVASMNWVEFL